MKDKYKILLLFILIFLSVFSVYALNPKIEGDSLLYVNSIEVLETGVQPTGFIPMMILTTYLGLKLIMFFNFFTGSIATSWSIVNALLYITMGLFFYSLLKRFIKDTQVAFISALFFITNYAAVSFGLAFMMDIGGWAAYVASIYFSYRYLENESLDNNKWLYASSIAIGIGGLYKEYAFVAYVVLWGILVFKNWRQWGKIFWKSVATLSIALGPFFVMNIYTYFYFDQYTYIDWFMHNQHTYTYQNRLVEFIKSFGSIYNFAWPLFLGGFYMLLVQTREIFRTKNIDKNILFLWLVVASGFSVLLWPVVTRVLFITMPGIILISSLFVKKIEKNIFIIAPILVVYIIASFLMDAFILDFVNLPF